MNEHDIAEIMKSARARITSENAIPVTVVRMPAEEVAALLDEIERLTRGCADLQALKADPAPGEWVEWKGGECPIAAGTWCGARLRDGSEDVRLAEEWEWMHDELEWDIVAYRIIQ